MAIEQLDVEHLFTLDLQVAEGPQIIKGGPHGTRIIAEVAGGTFTGERLNGTSRSKYPAGRSPHLGYRR